MLLKGKNVLIIEDNENDMKIAESHLKSQKSIVFKCDTGEKALEIFRKKDIDLVIIDYRLPYKNGLMITHEIKNIREVPIILVTGIDEVIQDVDYIKKFKFDDIIRKPYHKSDLLESIEKLEDGFKNVNKSNNNRYWYMSILFVFFIFFLIFQFRPKHLTNDEIFAQYYTSENVIDITRGDNINESLIKFQQRDFKSATIMFDEIIKNDSSNISFLFYDGVSNIEIGNYNKSIQIFNYIISHQDNLYIEHSQWFLGLCYLKNNQKDKAFELFTELSKDPENYYTKNAKEILHELK